jgi:Domain of unknown function (DUF3943)
VVLAAALVPLLLAQGGDAPRALPPSAPSWRVPAAHAAGVLLGMRLAVSVAWPDAYDPTRLGSEGTQLRLAYTRPPELRGGNPLTSDGDPVWLNGIAHALFGSEVYGRTRQCGHGPLAGLLAAASASVAWEYGLEAPYKRPSAIDLVWTPFVGALVGEGRFRLWRWLETRGAGWGWRVAVDPLGEFERGVLRTRC